MQERAIEILGMYRTMAISTLRPDGWPQTTIVGYANDGLTLYFLVFRTSQKLANMRQDKRISIAIGGEPDPDGLTAVYAAAHASEVSDPKERDRQQRALTLWLLLAIAVLLGVLVPMLLNRFLL